MDTNGDIVEYCKNSPYCMHLCGLKTTRVLHAVPSRVLYAVLGSILRLRPKTSLPHQARVFFAPDPNKVNWKNRSLLGSSTMPLQKKTWIMHLFSKHHFHKARKGNSDPPYHSHQPSIAIATKQSEIQRYPTSSGSSSESVGGCQPQKLGK